MKFLKFLLFVAAIALIGVGVWLSSGSEIPTISWDFADLEVVNETITFDEPIDTISLNLQRQDVVIETSLDDELSILFHGTYASKMTYTITDGELEITHPLSEWEYGVGGLFNDEFGWVTMIRIPYDMVHSFNLNVIDSTLSMDGQRVQNLATISLIDSTLIIKDSIIASLHVEATNADVLLTEVDVPLSHIVTGDEIVYQAEGCELREVEYIASNAELYLGSVTAYRLTAEITGQGNLVAEQLMVSHYVDIDLGQGEVAIAFAQPKSSMLQVYLLSTDGYVYFDDEMAEYSYSESFNGTLQCDIRADYSIMVQFEPA